MTLKEYKKYNLLTELLLKHLRQCLKQTHWEMYVYLIDSVNSWLMPNVFSRVQATLQLHAVIARTRLSHTRGYRNTAPAQLSATVLPRIRPCWLVVQKLKVNERTKGMKIKKIASVINLGTVFNFKTRCIAVFLISLIKNYFMKAIASDLVVRFTNMLPKD